MKSLAFNAFAAGLSLHAFLVNIIAGRLGWAALNAFGFVACSTFALLRFRAPSLKTRAESLGARLGVLVLNSIADRVDTKSLTVNDAQTAIRCAASVLERGERAARKGTPS